MILKNMQTHIIYLSKLKEYRNYFLAPIGVGLTVFLGSIPIFNPDAWTFLIILFSLAIAGSVIFVIFTRLIAVVERIYAELDSIFREGIEHLGMSYGFFIASVADLSIVNFSSVDNYRLFTHLLLGAVMRTFSNRFKELAVQYWYIPDFKKFSELESTEYSKNLHLMRLHFQKFNRTLSFPLGLLEFVEEVLKEYKPNSENNNK